jgi:hypothetical protein
MRSALHLADPPIRTTATDATPASAGQAAVVRDEAPRSRNSFLSAKCVVRKADDKGGHAVFAAEPISKGELIVVWSGTLVDGATLETYPASVRRYSLQVEEDHFLVSLTDCEPSDYVNHSCSPNAGLSGQISLVAMRDIAPGEEITYDYAMSDGSAYDEFPCACGSPLCRGGVSSRDWMREDLWERYAGFFSPYLSARIDRLRASRKATKRVRRRVAAKADASVAAP